MITFVVDPGAKGGYVVAYDGLKALVPHPLNGISDLVDHVRELSLSHKGGIEAVVEDVPCYCGKDIPGSSTFKLGKNCGLIEGIFRGLEIPVTLIAPKTWQKGLSGLKGLSGNPRKRVLKEHASRLYPTLRPTLRTADAILLCHHFFNR